MIYRNKKEYGQPVKKPETTPKDGPRKAKQESGDEDKSAQDSQD